MKKSLIALIMINPVVWANDELNALKQATDADHIKQQVQQAIKEEVQLRTTGVDANTKVKQVFTDDNFDEVDWHDQDHSYTVFSAVDFSDSDLSGVDFSYAVFSNSDFSNSNLDGACFYGAKFSNTDIHEDNSVDRTNFTNSNQSNFDVTANTDTVIWKDQPCGQGLKK